MHSSQRFRCVSILLSLVCLALSGLASGQATTLTQGLEAYYSFDALGNPGNDDTGNGRNGTLENGVAVVGGKLVNGLLFDGADDYVSLNIGPLISSMTNCTIATWADFSNQGGAWQRIFDFGTNTTVNMFLTPRTDTAGPMRFAITINGNGAEERATAPSTLATGWHYVTVAIEADADTLRPILFT